MEVSHTSKEIQLDSIGQIALTVREIGESREFYRNALGMKFLFDAGAMAFFQCGSVRLMIGAAEKPVTPTGTILYFRVSEIQDAYVQLKARNVEFIDEPHLIARMPDHDLWMVFLKDPSGNVIGLMSEVRADPAAPVEGGQER